MASRLFNAIVLFSTAWVSTTAVACVDAPETDEADAAFGDASSDVPSVDASPPIESGKAEADAAADATMDASMAHDTGVDVDAAWPPTK